MVGPVSSSRLREALNGAFDRLIPPICVTCARALPAGSDPLCGICASRLPVIAPPRCGRCGATAPPPGRSDRRCAECADWSEVPARVVSAFAYEDGARSLVHALKYGGWTQLAAPMGRALAPELARLNGADACCLVPVPLSAARRRERGFNQAELLARSLGASTGHPVVGLLTRTGSSRTQATASREQRRGNVTSAFRLADARWIEGPAVLVDDVVTTGATAGACAAALIDAGVPCAGIVSFARTLGRFEGAG